MLDKKIVQKIVLGGIILNSNRILVLQRNKDEDVLPGIWELPSGKKEFLENSEKALIREIKEECNLDVDIVMPLSVFDYQIEKPDEMRDSTQINFIVKPKNNLEVKLSEEHQSFAWIEEKEINDYNITELVKKLIKKTFCIAPLLKRSGIL